MNALIPNHFFNYFTNMQCYFTDAILLIFYVVIKLNINDLPQKKLNINKILICEVKL
jgi:hypothetical protein